MSRRSSENAPFPYSGGGLAHKAYRVVSDSSASLHSRDQPAGATWAAGSFLVATGTVHVLTAMVAGWAPDAAAPGAAPALVPAGGL